MRVIYFFEITHVVMLSFMTFFPCGIFHEIFQKFLNIYLKFIVIVIINIQELTSSNLVLRTTVVTPVNPQKSKFKTEQSCQVSF
jgi:hypothetical protein